MDCKKHGLIILAGRTVCWIAFLSFLSLPVLSYARAPEKIVTLAPNVTETVYALGQGSKIIAVSHQCDYPPEVREKKRIGDMINPSLERIVSLKPDLVILTDDGNPRAIWEKLQVLNIPTHVYGPRRLNDLGCEIKRLGRALGVSEMAHKIAYQVEAGIESHRRMGKKGTRMKRALFVLQVNPIIVAGSRTAIGDVMSLLGLENMPFPNDLPYPTLSREQIVSFNPEIIFIDRDLAKGEIMKWTEIAAVRGGCIFPVGPAIYRMSPRILVGIQEMFGYLKTLP